MKEAQEKALLDFARALAKGWDDGAFHSSMDVHIQRELDDASSRVLSVLAEEAPPVKEEVKRCARCGHPWEECRVYRHCEYGPHHRRWTMTNTPRYVTVSEMQDYLKDEWRWYAKWRLNRVPRKWSEALILGTAVHDIYEMHFGMGPSRGLTMAEAYSRVYSGISTVGLDPGHAFATAAAKKQLAVLRDAVVNFRDTYPVEETLAVEEAFEEELLPGVLFRGRPDRETRLVSSRIVHMQHKTLAGNKSVETYTRSLARSFHETMYGWHLSKKYGPDYAGSVINVIRKGTKKAPLPGFQVFLPLDARDYERAWVRAKIIARRMLRSQEVGDTAGIWALVDDPQNDAGVYGNSLDGYLPVLQGKASLDDDTLFMPREETYDAVVSDG